MHRFSPLPWIVVAQLLCGCGETGTPGPVDLFFSDRILNIAHRGGGNLAPESTLEGFTNAVAVGADVLELDVHSTSDDVIVCIHDSSVDRTTDGTGRVHQLTFGELRQLDAGYRFTRDGGETFPFRGEGVRVPSLLEVLSAFPDRHFMIEIKQADPPIVEPVLALVRDHLSVTQVVLGSATDNIIEQVRVAWPEALTSYATAEMIRLVTMTAEEEDRYRPPAVFAIPPAEVVEPEFMRRAGRFGLKVYPWTVNEEDEMESLIHLGVHGIITDDPSTLAGVIGEQG